MKLFVGIISLFIIFEGTWLYQKKPLEQSITDGKEIYNDFCVQCHLDNGEGFQESSLLWPSQTIY